MGEVPKAAAAELLAAPPKRQWPGLCSRGTVQREGVWGGGAAVKKGDGED